MLVVAIAGVLVLAGIGVLCFAAYKINAESFEFSTAFLKLVSFSIKIMSPGQHGGDEDS
jgi:hypothetical protein